ncbi:hypothetical protein AV530_013217 [Patagioenas fasciata monilis]|uniref:Uncharacterized protein n=1 Tax=Patagioenas fasciata monilis TaxID=372326 RepID=A0A1V4JNL2_PATFA|nr:hypothetical protein AV530_013217 [Patagioenas fasciata monilis]
MVAAERTASRAAQESTRAGRACFRVSRAEWQLGRWERKAAAPAPAVPATERGSFSGGGALVALREGFCSDETSHPVLAECHH